MSFGDWFATKKLLKNAKNNLTERQFFIVKALLNNPMGLSKKELESLTGLKLSGWDISELKKKGYNVHKYSGQYVLSF